MASHAQWPKAALRINHKKCLHNLENFGLFTSILQFQRLPQQLLGTYSFNVCLSNSSALTVSTFASATPRHLQFQRLPQQLLGTIFAEACELTFHDHTTRLSSKAYKNLVHWLEFLNIWPYQNDACLWALMPPLTLIPAL